MFKVQIDLVDKEKIEFVKGANHFKGIEAVGGKFFVTNQRIVFKSHSFNIQNHELTIEFHDIQSIKFYNTGHFHLTDYFHKDNQTTQLVLPKCL